MTGITGYSVHVPRYRIRRETIAAAWNVPTAPGCKAVRNFDEDSLTMGQAAVWQLVEGSAEIESLYFASTTAPYWQRSPASLIAACCDLPPTVATADFSGSLRCGMTALRTALECGKPAIIVAADARDGAPESAGELAFGDAAAAVRIGREEVLAEVIAAGGRSDDFPDEWRRDSDPHVHSVASKYSTTRGYEANVVELGRALLRDAGIQPADVARAALVSPDGRAHLAAARALGIAADRVEDVRAGDIGLTGAAMPLLILARALDRARSGDLILAIGYGDGADGLLLRVGNHRPLLESDWRAIEYSSYPLYRKLRNFFKTEGGGPEISNVLAHHQEPQNVRLHGSLCPRCGTINFPMAQVCGSCRNASGLTEKPLGRKGRLFTFTKDFLYDAPVKPTVMAVIDLEGGGRFLCQMTDVDPAEVEIGMPVELVLRRMRESAVDHHYYWKCRPV
jgi:hydroxymethylglutaryl-CoA synthase